MKQLSKEQLEGFLQDIRDENEWRAQSNMACDYYDNKQLSSEIMRAMEERGMAPLVRNYIRPTIDLALGMEARNKRDWALVAERDQDLELAEALGARLKEVERQTNADDAISNAYASQIKAGLGWVEVARSHNPFAGPYRVANVHRNEISWDWRAKEPDLSDGRFLVRHRWLDRDVLEAWFPKHAKKIRILAQEEASWDIEQEMGDSQITMDAANAQFAQFATLNEAEWRDCGGTRKRLKLYEVWYRIWTNGLAMVFPDGRVMEFDEHNLRHTTLVGTGMARVQKAVFPKVRLSWWVGPEHLADIPSPYPHAHFPYVPFWCFREDRTGVPYGLIRFMLSPQDEINARLTKMMWLLSAKRIIADSDAADMPWAQVVEEAARPDALLLTNPNRKNKGDGITVETDFALSKQQFEVLRDATQAIQDTAGIYQAMLGKGGAESGVAIDSLVEQGSTTLAEPNDNYRFSRKRVGELLLALVSEDIGSAETPVIVDRMGKKKTITLNKRGEEDGTPTLTNALSDMRARVELSDIPDTPTHRAHQFQMLTEFAKSLPPEAQVALVPFYAKMSDLTDREEIVRILQGVLGNQKDPDEMTPDEIAAQQAEQELAQRAQTAEVEKSEAEVARMREEIEKLAAEVEKIRAETELKEQEQVFNEDKHPIELEDAAVKPEMEKAKAEQQMVFSEQDHAQAFDHKEQTHQESIKQQRAVGEQKLKHSDDAAKFKQQQAKDKAKQEKRDAKPSKPNLVEQKTL